MSLYEDVKAKIIRQLEHAANSAKAQGELNFEELPGFVLEEPRERQHGDLATNLAMVMAKQAKRPPREIAAALIKHMDKTGTWIETSEIAGAGFINFHLNPLWLTGVIKEVLQAGSTTDRLTWVRDRKFKLSL